MARAATEKMHSTAFEAATIAAKAGVKKLLIGHYSARYDDLQPLLDEARSVFPGTLLAEDGLSLDV
jgi:ribonuclease Z